ncbi:chemotaxis protein CheB [Dyella sp.]|uniref:chemotaxis protein CheB n=1 Tax=Dyella sp. TaxID=1869338 RepID=UPI002ED5BF83
MSPSGIDIVVVGASAGGVHALQAVLGSLPPDWLVPVVCVLHLPRDRPSGLAALMAHSCALPVSEAEDKQPIRPGTVVFAPPDYHLLIEDRSSLALSHDAPVLFSRPAIDVLFESAAIAFGPSVLAILLTGASADGSDGVAQVRREGGTVWIQAPEDAVAPTMPASAIAKAGADLILPLDELCQRLVHSQP